MIQYCLTAVCYQFNSALPQKSDHRTLLYAEYFYFSGHFTGRMVKDENSALLGYYSASGGNFSPTLRDNLSNRTHPSHIQGSRTLSKGPIGCSETSVRNYHRSLRNNPEERSSQLLRGGSLKSRIVQ